MVLGQFDEISYKVLGLKNAKPKAGLSFREEWCVLKQPEARCRSDHPPVHSRKLQSWMESVRHVTDMYRALALGQAQSPWGGNNE